MVRYGFIWENQLDLKIFFACGYGQVLVSSDDFPKYGLNIHDFDNLRWEDESVEVFINMED